MNDEEILKYIKEDKKLYDDYERLKEYTARLGAVIQLLIEKNIISEKEYNDKYDALSKLYEKEFLFKCKSLIKPIKEE